MKGFLLSMVVGVGISTVAAVVLARALLPPSVWEQPSAAQRVGGAGDFSPHEAVEAVAARFSSTLRAMEMIRALKSRARVEYHSRNHWTVRLDDASWTAHGAGGPAPTGHYAAPDNAAARRMEADAAGH